MTNREVVVLSAVRTPIGKFSGALKDIPPTELAAKVVSESLKRSGLSAAEIGDVALGKILAPIDLPTRNSVCQPLTGPFTAALH